MGCIQSFREFCDRSKNTNVRFSLPAVCIVWQTAMIILFGVFIRYDEESNPHWIEHRKEANISSDIENDFYFRYPSKWLHLGSSLIQSVSSYFKEQIQCSFCSWRCNVVHEVYFTFRKEPKKKSKSVQADTESNHPYIMSWHCWHPQVIISLGVGIVTQLSLVMRQVFTSRSLAQINKYMKQPIFL